MGAIRAFFSKIRALFLWFSKKGRGGLPPSPPLSPNCAPAVIWQLFAITMKWGLELYEHIQCRTVSKAIMLITKLRNQFLKKRTLDVKNKFNKLRNICVSLVRKAKQNYYKNLDLKSIGDNKDFWAVVKPLSSDKIKAVENIFLDR